MKRDSIKGLCTIAHSAAVTHFASRSFIHQHTSGASALRTLSCFRFVVFSSFQQTKCMFALFEGGEDDEQGEGEDEQGEGEDKQEREGER